jgi:hypothetical protein
VSQQHYHDQVRAQLAEARQQLADTRVRTAYLESVVRYLTEESNRDEASRDRFWRAWQSTIVEARRQHARAGAAEARIAAVRALAAELADGCRWSANAPAISEEILAALDGAADDPSGQH